MVAIQKHEQLHRVGADEVERRLTLGGEGVIEANLSALMLI